MRIAELGRLREQARVEHRRVGKEVVRCSGGHVGACEHSPGLTAPRQSAQVAAGLGRGRIPTNSDWSTMGARTSLGLPMLS